MFDTVLVAGRGVLTARVVRTCQRLGARTVTVHSQADAGAPHAVHADESLLLGGPDPATTYLDGRKVIEAAGQAAAQALHPGSGPLATSAAFAQSVVDAGLVWLGPPPAVLAALAAWTAAPHREGRRVVVHVLGLADGSLEVVADHARSAGLVVCPAPGLPEGARDRLHSAALAAAAEHGMVGPATVELALDAGDTPAVVGLGVGATLEQAAVELATGVDLAEQQLRISGDAPVKAGAVDPGGVALQQRLRAAGAGVLTAWQPPDGEGVRVEAGYAEGAEVLPYDDLLAALTVWAPDATTAGERLQAATAAWVVDGVPLLRPA